MRLPTSKALSLLLSLHTMNTDMPDPSEQDLKYAAELRTEIHKEVLERVRLVNPNINSVIDPYPVESYFQWNWEYPGAWYIYVAIPEGFRSRTAFVDFLVKKTLYFYLTQ